MRRHGTLRFHANPAAADGFRTGSPGALWAVNAAPHVMIKVKRLFPRSNPYRTGWITIGDTPEVARDLEWLLERYPMDADEETLARLHARAGEHRQTEEAVQAILTGRQERLVLQEPARPARDYQLVAADLALTTGRLLLCDELGLGKSMSGLLVLRDPKALPALVVCPTHLQRQWRDEVAKTLPLLRTHIVTKGSVYDPARRMRGHDPDVLIVPYSKLRGWADHLAGKVRTVIFDEVQELRRSDSQKYVAAGRVADAARYRVGLTATPVYNYAGEIHNVLSVIARDVLGSREEFLREWSGSTDRYGYLRSVDNARVGDPAALGIYLRDEGIMLRRTRRDVGRELPDIVRVPHSIDTDQDLLERLVEEAADLAEVIVSRAVAREELFRASGEFDWRMRRATGLAKAPYVAEFVKLLLETDERVVLFGWHRDVYDVWKRKLGDDIVFYTGTESPAQKAKARDAFVAGDNRVLIMSLRAGSGLDGLQDAAHVAVFGELDWSPGMHDQCIGRLHRDGQAEPVVAYFLLSDHGADPVMAEVLNLKRMQSEPLQDPDVALFNEMPDTADRIRRLAEDVLRRRRRV